MPQKKEPSKKTTKASQKDSSLKVGKILSSINPAQLKKGIDLFSQIQKSGQADALKKQFENIDKDKIMDMFNKLDPNVVKKKVNNIDLNNIDINEYAKKTSQLGLNNQAKSDRKD